MKFVFSILLVCSLVSCQTSTLDYSVVVVRDGVVDSSFVDKIDEPARMLMGWYLFAYGNECGLENKKPKCQILNLLSVGNECDTVYLGALRKWFKDDMYRSIKLKKCPSLSAKGAIQNEFKYLYLERHQDTLSISYRVDGLNNSQEKSWNVERVERFIVVDNSLLSVRDKNN